MADNFVLIISRDKNIIFNNRMFEILAGNYVTRRVYETEFIIFTSEDNARIIHENIIKLLPDAENKLMIVYLKHFFGTLPSEIWKWMDEKRPEWRIKL